MKKTERIQILNIMVTTSGTVLCFGGLLLKDAFASIVGCILICAWYILQAQVVLDKRRTAIVNGKKQKGTIVREPSKLEIGFKKVIAWFNE